ncbi:DUF2868 domain-containing protein [Variovorax sp. HJSM1_2]|uniref:DUF2868 domain-containing protein n=1 Tax=Variovorax sp. HJSM1_2 TaxID=3366263 RepID=UPI003BD3DBF1
MNHKSHKLDQIWMAQAVQHLEAQGPLNDGPVLQAVLAESPDRETRLLARAWSLGQAQGLERQMQHLRDLALLMALGLVVLVLALAWGTARATLGSGSTINVAAAWASLLGLHFVTLLLWCLGLVLPWPASGALLGRLWLALVTRLPWGRGPEPGNSASLAYAGRDLLQRERLLPWLLGLVSHGVWTLSFVVMLVVLGFAFSFQAFRLTWESTILSPQFFVDFVQASGWLPGLLGVPVPDVASVAQPNAALADQRAWALWLMGCVLVYGLLPRALLALCCWAVWRRRLRGLRLDTSEPYFRKILARIEALQPVAVLDEEHAWAAAAAAPGQRAPADATACAIVGFELPPELAWAPPKPLPNAWQHRLAGSGSERQAVLASLHQRRPAALLLVCHGASSPDRGTERFVRVCAAQAGACSILLVAAEGAVPQAAHVARWADWLSRSGLEKEGVGLCTDGAAAEQWLALQTGHAA